MIALILSAALGQWSPQPPGMLQYDPGAQCQRTGGRCFLNRSGNRPRANYAFFEFAPADGAGMGAACACTAVTGAKGEALTFTRAGEARCFRQGFALTGILAGDVVTCTANQPRVVPNPSGVRGYWRESGITNVALRTEEWDNATWTKEAGVTVSANDVACPTAPDNASTADLVTFAGLSNTGLYQPNTTPNNSTVTHSVFVARRTSGGAACTLTLTDGYTALAGTSFSVPAAGAGWTRVIDAAAVTVGTTSGIYLKEVTAGDCTDVCVWGAQNEVSSFASSYIPTVAVGVARSADSALSVTLASGIGPNFCAAGSASWPSSLVTTGIIAQLGTAAPDLASIGRNTNTAASFVINATTTTPAVAAIGTSTVRAYLADASGTRAAFWNAGSVAAPAASMTGASTAFSFGALDAITTAVQVDPSRCTP